MKTDTSVNYLLVVFCVVLLAFAFFSSRLSDKLQAKQHQLELQVK